MARVSLACSIATAAVLVLASGCGASSAEELISRPEELSALRNAGFEVRPVLQGRAVATATTRLPWVELFAVRFPTSSQATRAYEQGYSPRAVTEQFRDAQGEAIYSGVFPRGFRRSMVRTERVCNVIVLSYSPTPRPELGARFERAVALLKRACR